MKISNDELIQLVWLNQLRNLARGVVCVYFGEEYGLLGDSDFYFSQASKERRCREGGITTLLGKGQLWVRLKALHESGALEIDKGAGAFWLDGEGPRLAWLEARQFWIARGLLPLPHEPKPFRAEEIDQWVEQCRDLLLARFSGAYAPQVQSAA